MAGSFRSTYHHKVDGKGRVSIPASFRRGLELGDPDWRADGGGPPRVIVVTEFEEYPCITCMTLARMESLEKEAAASGDPDALDIFEEDVVACSDELKLDDNGRISLSPDLRKSLGIASEVTFVGKRDRFEIWEPGVFSTHRRNRSADTAQRKQRRSMIRGIRVASAARQDAE
ncbi:MAG: cell division/cell wall cluster transcriptional repressor MraZ [Pseudomonadota bacterium]